MHSKLDKLTAPINWVLFARNQI